MINSKTSKSLKCFRSTSLFFPWAGNKASQYTLPTSRLLQDSSLAHHQAISNSIKRRGTWQREFCGCGIFTAVRIHTAVVGFPNSTWLCFPWAGNTPQYPLPNSKLVQDPSLAHRQALSNSRKRRGRWHREFCGCGTFTAVRIRTAVVGF